MVEWDTKCTGCMIRCSRASYGVHHHWPSLRQSSLNKYLLILSQFLKVFYAFTNAYLYHIAWFFWIHCVFVAGKQPKHLLKFSYISLLKFQLLQMREKIGLGSNQDWYVWCHLVEICLYTQALLPDFIFPGRAMEYIPWWIDVCQRCSPVSKRIGSMM